MDKFKELAEAVRLWSDIDSIVASDGWDCEVSVNGERHSAEHVWHDAKNKMIEIAYEGGR